MQTRIEWHRDYIMRTCGIDSMSCFDPEEVGNSFNRVYDEMADIAPENAAELIRSVEAVNPSPLKAHFTDVFGDQSDFIGTDSGEIVLRRLAALAMLAKIREYLAQMEVAHKTATT